MPNAYLRQSALAHLGLEARAQAAMEEAGITLGERAYRRILDLRGPASDPGFLSACADALGFALPLEANRATGDEQASALWLGPDQWWLVTAEEGDAMAEALRAALDGRPCALTEVGESRACIHVAGPRARDLLAKGSPLDLHPRAFGAGHCAQGLLAKASVTIHQVSEAPAFDIYVARSFAEYLWLWLEDAAREYGSRVASGKQRKSGQT